MENKAMHNVCYLFPDVSIFQSWEYRGGPAWIGSIECQKRSSNKAAEFVTRKCSLQEKRFISFLMLT